MAEKPLHKPLLPNEDDCNNLTEPPTYNEGMASHLLNQPVSPEQQSCQAISFPAVPQTGIHRRLLQQQVGIPLRNMDTSNVNVVMPVCQVLPVGPDRMRMICYHCGADIKTTTTKSNKDTAHISCMMLSYLTCCLCFWIPYCCDACKKVDHRCPSCNEYLGTYNA